MKLIIIIMTAFLLQVSASTFAQRITLKSESITLKGVFSQIRKQTGYVVLAESSQLNSRPISINLLNVPLEEAMEKILDGQGLSFSIEEKTIVIKKREKSIFDKVIDYFATIDVTGKVTDSDGKPLPGATITIKGTRISATTDNEGSFSLKNVDENAILVITYLGYEPKETKAVANLGPIKLTSSLSKLDEVQVIAYGSTSKRLSTSNIGTIKADDIAKQPVSNPLLALQGRVSGITIVQNTGVPGGGVTVRIQGQNSIRSGNDPLYVVDGVPIVSQLSRTGTGSNGLDGVLGNSGTVAEGAPEAAGNPLSYLNTTDIESIDVLKDADAVAIYGSRAANGAILISTKKGKAGKLRANFNIQNGWGQVTRKLAVLDSRQYLDMRYEAYRNDGIDWKASTVTANDIKVWDTTRYTNWQEELIGRTAHFQTINGTFSGGSENTQYLLGTSYNYETTVFPGENANRRASVHFNLNSQSADGRFRIQLSSNFMNNNNKLPRQDLTQKALFMEPVAPAPFNEDGTLNWALNAAGSSTYTSNPYIQVIEGYKNVTNNLITNAILGYKILPNLELSASGGHTLMITDDYSSTPTTAIAPNLRATNFNSARYGHRNINSITVEPQLSYKARIFKGRLDALLGMTFLEQNTNAGSFSGRTYASDALLENFQSAQTLTPILSTILQYRYTAFFGRLNYNFGDQYIANITARHDGSSRFGENNRFHTFAAVGAAWIFTKNPIVQKMAPWLSFGKLRGSFGVMGNDQIADYQYISKYSSRADEVAYQSITTLYASSLPDPNLEWERTRKISASLDLGFLQDRFLFNMTYSNNTSDNQLGPYLLPTTTGFSSTIKNFPGTVRNRTWEFMVNTRNIRSKGFDWQSSVNLTLPKNRLVAFPGLETSTYANTLIVGEPLSIRKAYNFVGVDAATGSYQFMDSKGNLTNNPATSERYILVSLDPKWYGGIQNTVQMGNFQLDFLWQFVKQTGTNMYYGNLLTTSPGSFILGTSNQPASVLDRWRNTGDNASVARFRSASLANSKLYVSTANYSDASYLRLKNVSFSWKLPQSWSNQVKVQNCRLYVQAQNLLTITSYTGLDPENQGNASLPPLRVVMLGAQIDL